MNLTENIVKWHKRYKPIPKPFYVTKCDDHFIVSELDDNGNLLYEWSLIHWNKWTVRRWALEAYEARVRGDHKFRLDRNGYEPR
jgi:hypothetical protein